MTCEAPTVAARSDLSAVRRWCLLDRPAEFGEIDDALTDAESGGVVLVGNAGVGQTTLARAVTAALRRNVRWVAGTESARSIPLGPFADIAGTDGSRDPVALLSRARESLVVQEDTILGVDDAHLFDELSATLLHQLAIERTTRIIATVRSGEPAPDAITALWKDGYLRRIELQPFTKAQSVDLLETVLGGRLEGLSADVLWETSGGNALFLRHLAEGALEAKRLTRTGDVWQLRGGTVVTSGLAELLDSRIRRIDDATLNALRLVALSEPLCVDVLCELAGISAVEDAEARSLLRVVHDGRGLVARLQHPMLGEVIRQRLGIVAARQLRGRLVRALRTGRTQAAPDRILLAQLWIDSDQEQDPAFLVTAAKDAMSLYNVPLGERIARAALEHNGGLEAAEVLSRALLWQGRPDAADDALAQFDPDDLGELELVRWGIPRASTLFWGLDARDRAYEILALLEDRVRHPSLLAMVTAVRCAIMLHENQIETGLALADQVVTNPLAPRQAVEWAAFAAGLAIPVAGRGSSFDAIADRCRTEQKATDGMIRIMIRYGEVLALVTTGDLDRAVQRAASYAVFSSAGQVLAWAIAKIMAGVVDLARGRLPDVVSFIEQALAALTADVSLPWQLPARLVGVRAYAALGRADDAARLLADADEHRGEHTAIHEPQRTLAQAWLAGARAADRTAVDLARQAADAARASGQYAVEADALHAATRFGDHTTADRLAELADFVDGRTVLAQARHAAAAARSDGAALDAASAEFESLGLLLYAADAAAQAASVHDRKGHRAAMAASSTRATQLAAACGGARTPAIRSAASPLPFTTREREIAILVAAGLTSREIAERLVVSTRTVEGHIYHACLKVNVGTREELGDLLRQQTATLG